MSYLCLALGLSLRQSLGRWKYWALLALVLAGAVAWRLALRPSEAGAVTVGVVLPETGGEAFWTRLEARGDELVQFRRSSPEEAERMVSTGRWDCALVLAEDFDRRLAAGTYEDLVTVVIGPGSAVYPLVREGAAAVLLELAAPVVARDYLLSRGLADPAAMEALWPRLTLALPEGRRVTVAAETLDGTPLQPLALAGAGRDQVFRGVLAVLLLVWALSAAGDLGRWRESDLARRLLTARSLPEVLLPQLGGLLLPPFLAGGAALWLAGGEPVYVLMLLPYLLALGGLALLLARLPRVCRLLPALLPLAAAAGLLLSPVLLDVTLLFPGLAPVSRLLPVTLYLEGCGGHPWGAAGLLVLALALGGPALFLRRPGPGP